ncbi:MAG: MgtC/SapB family protein [Deltaproteobacteria bacterium]|nr:MgtC/SapB family protein [Deltaproteobacteria bacterium]
MQHELEFLRSLPIGWITKIAVAVLCGAIIGIERQLRRKAAGMRTNVMICLGAALYVLAAELIALRDGTAHMDPSRLAGQVVVGMGFIGAGSIIQSRGRIQGLTSAATMWVVAAIGVLIGLGFPLLGLIVTVLVVGLLEGVRLLEHHALGRCRMVTTRLSFRDQPQTWERLREVCAANDHPLDAQQVRSTTVASGARICFLELHYCYTHPDHAEVLFDLLKIPDVRQTSFEPGATPPST